MTDSSRSRRGGAKRSAAPPKRHWQERIDDPDEPLYTMAIASDLLSIDTQTLRRLEDACGMATTRPSGNQRRYSRNELGVLHRAAQLAMEGQNASGIGRILELEREVAALTSRRR